jgi:5,5'-dehydrodivanillate O-demethylase
MGEDLTLYRWTSGLPYLVGGLCAHRRTALHTGWVEGEQIRCMYHGWRYDGSGLCTEIPAEKRPRKEVLRIEGYPLVQYHGLIFVYMGPGEAPAFQLPMKRFLDEPGRRVISREQVWDCNWLQQVENSLDAVHVSFAHVWGKVSRFGEELSTAVPELEYQETEAGIRQTATRSRDNVRVSDWTFPNNNHVVVPGPRKGDAWSDLTVWAVPIDDHSTMRFTLYAFPASAEQEAEEFFNDPDQDYNPADHAEELIIRHILPDVSHTQVLAAQDYVPLRGQGVIADRINENLSSSDAGIVLLRRLLMREAACIEEGQPTKAWKRLHDIEDLPIPTAQETSI